MKRIAFIFKSIPYGTSSGREGLDVVFSAGMLIEHMVGVFFVSDGVLQLLPEQQSELILTQSYAVTFDLLKLYKINNCYLAKNDLLVRGFSEHEERILDVKILHESEMRKRLENYDFIMTF